MVRSRAATVEEYLEQLAGERRAVVSVRFRELEDLPLDAIGRVVAGTPPAEFIAAYEAARRG